MASLKRPEGWRLVGWGQVPGAIQDLPWLSLPRKYLQLLSWGGRNVVPGPGFLPLGVQNRRVQTSGAFLPDQNCSWSEPSEGGGVPGPLHDWGGGKETGYAAGSTDPRDN